MENFWEVFMSTWYWPLIFSVIGLVILIGAIRRWSWVLSYSGSTQYANRSMIFSRRTVMIATGIGFILLGIVLTVALYMMP